MDKSITMASMRPDKQQTWHDVLESVKVSVSEAIFTTWFSQTQLISLKKLDKKRYLAEVGCLSAYVKSTIETRYFGIIQDALIKTIDAPCDLTFTVKQLVFEQKDDKTHPAPLFDKPNEEEFLNNLTRARLQPNFTFENFAVSDSNQMAHAAAEAVSRLPADAYNPLFIWGGVGVGKTHLMNSVGYSLVSQGIDKVYTCSGEEFTNEIIQGIRNKTTPAFREKYRKLKALLIDDIQFIAGKDSVQAEFFHTFNAVTASGGQVIMTSDQPPSDIAKLEERLKSRFQAGLIVDISQANFELRCAIIHIKTSERGLSIENSLVHLIAGNISAAREIQGFVTKLISESKLKKLLVNEELVKNLLSKGGLTNGSPKKRTTSANEVVDAVCGHFSITKRVLMGPIRTKIIVRPRQILMYILRTELQLPFQEVGRVVGGRDHSTVMHAVEKITQLASSDVDTREDILGIKNSL